MNLIGKIIGNRYEVLEEVGLGGMATVFKAKDHVLNRLVAVKVLKDEFTTDNEFIKRFNTEAQAAASLSHPNIVSIYDVGHEEENNLYYIVMELVQGKTLKEIINAEGVLSWKWSLNIAMQIASALELAHKNGIIHRDIKPHNIIITEDGIAKVTDFGIAKAVSNSTITAFGTTIGSVHYFSPEQAKGGITDAKSDLYSLGVVMYEMLTGKVPFDADTPVSVALKHMQEDAREPIDINNEIPSAVNKIVVKAMQKDPINRYNSATEMLGDLRKALKDPEGDFVIIENKDGGYTRVMQAVKDESIPNKKTEVKTKTGFFTEHPKAKVAVIILGLILLFVVVFLITKIAIDGGIKKKVEIPNLVGITREESEIELESKKLKLEIEEIASSEVEAGKIISQEPMPEDGKVEEGTTIKIRISKGPETTELVKLEGMKIEDARNTAKEIGITLEEVNQNSDTVEAGYIIKQETPVGTLVKSGDKVKVYVSSGIEKVKVPTVLGMDEGTAIATLKNANLSANVTYKSDENAENGKVISQSVDANKEVAKNTKIDIVVNKIVKENKTVKIVVDVKSIAGNKSNNNGKTNSANEVEVPSTVNVTVSIDGVEKTQNSAKVTDSSFSAYEYTGTGIHEITVKVGSSYTRTRKINFDESENGRNVIFDNDTKSD